MGLVDYLILFGLLALLTCVVYYIRRAKKKGKKCIGCPHSGNCGGCR